ncbi:alpha-ribazole phosphatase [Crassaminicella thermophila]|uniref:Alpha-ribazole phosphatase n=1 Tax=Crassaminicella thermophila TaxID=2599308 RepID=A0A5C0SDH1_CRATE|nr:alpha-ribazole phosphatase [Crassaminicella thermophila]QEK11806.1 alpha-ribazole phosphatase [Crassaminicella thermophila]
MLKIILVRHGETENNCDGLYCGWNDIFLTEKGLMQAKKVSEKLKEENFDYIISSDLDRTMKTAEIINQYHHVEIILESNIREMNFGLWEGLSYKEIKEKYPKEVKEWENDWIDYVTPNGESVKQMYERVTKAIDKIIHKNKRGNILIVAHAGSIRAILAYLIGRGMKDYWKYKIDNCGICIIEIIDKFPVLTALNQ